MKLNNKGFAISTILYGLSILILVLLVFLVKIMMTNNSNSKYYTEVIKKDLNLCIDESNDYKMCINTDDCNNAFKEYAVCYCNNIYKNPSGCANNATPLSSDNIDLIKVYKIMGF